MKPFLIFATIVLAFTSAQLQNTHQNNMKIRIGDKTFTATLHDNAAARTLKTLLPLKLDMVELNGNEKYGELPKDLPTERFSPGKIETGDILLYGSSTLVIFYKTFSSSYSYTRIGKIDDVTGLVEVLGKGNVQIRFDVQ